MVNGDVGEIIKRYEEKLQEQVGDELLASGGMMSKDYEIFRREALEKRVSSYEKWCNFCEKLLKVKVKETDRDKLLGSIETAHLDITPEGAASFAVIIGLLTILLGVGVGLASFALGNFFLITTLFFVISGAAIIKPLTHLPNYFATRWRLEASNQMVLCILYTVIYMRHTSNLEHAIKFAGEHVGLPLSLDLKKVLWNIETEKFLTIKESLDNYLEEWRNYNLEFVEAFHLIEGSLYEPIEERRIELLEKALQVMLEGTYDKMLHYAHNLKSPITVLYMLGIILPILGLVIFPLIGSFLSGAIKWYHLLVLYNIILPLFVYFMGNNILTKRPTGYGEGEILQTHPEFKTYESNIFILSFLIGVLIVGVGFIPVISHIVDPTFDMEFLGFKFLDYKGSNGPYGFWALLFSLFIPLGLALSMSLYYRAKTKKLIEVRKKTDDLEQEFSGAIFQLGNRIGDGLPAEVAFKSVADNMKGTNSGEFFRIVDNNIRNLGMGLKSAIFDSQRGGILYYPSKLVESSMKVLVESAKKGPVVASKSLITISNYVTRIRQVNERLKDLMADVLSSMTSQISFLTPVIAGIVVGVGSMVVTIINLLGEQFKSIGVEEGGFTGGIAAIANILRIEDVIPGFQFQLIVGLYVVQLTIILTILSTYIERGVDKTTTRYRIGKNLLKATSLYILIALIGIIVFNLLANAVTFAQTGAVT